jgi:DNA-binding transcriptional LysR family regulator
MELLQLRYFRTAAKMENITNTAESLNISQPSLSKTIINLESELGVPLFDRVGRHIYLNTRGKLFYEKISDALDIIDSAKNIINESASTPGGEINLLILAASRAIPGLIKAFLTEYPQIHIKLHQQVHHDLRYSEEYDFSISATPMDYSQLEILPLLTEKIVLAVPVSHPLAKRQIINLREAASCDFITYSRGPSIRILFDSLCYMSGFTPKIKCESDGVNTLLDLISGGFGVALLPRDTVLGFGAEEVIPVSIDNPAANRTINLSWRKEKYMSKACALFKQHCISYFREHILKNKTAGLQPIDYMQ